MQRPRLQAHPACTLLVALILVRTTHSLEANFTTIAGGLFHTCMILDDLTLKCFGGGNSSAVPESSPQDSIEYGYGMFGQIGSGNNKTYGDEAGEMGDNLPMVKLDMDNVTEVSAGQSHTCALSSSGDVACFGYNEHGQLGLGDKVARGFRTSDMGKTLAVTHLGTSVTNIGCGQHHCCAVLDTFDVKCWGRNDHGTLGLGDTDHRGDEPGEMDSALATVELGTGRTARRVQAGRHHTCALLDNHQLKCWGGGSAKAQNFGQLGQGNTSDVGVAPYQMGDNLTEIDLGSDRTVKTFAVGWYHACAILDNGKLRCFGRNKDGQLGLGDTEDRGDEEGEMGDNLPFVDLGDNKTVVSVACGRWHTCVLLNSHEVKCFGSSSSHGLGGGQLGQEKNASLGDTADSMGDSLPALDFGTESRPASIFAGFDHNCVIFEDKTTKCWGLNTSGQLGLGDTEDRGSTTETMGDDLEAVDVGGELLSESVEEGVSESVDGDAGDDDDASDDSGINEAWAIVLYVFGGGGAVFVIGAIYLCCQRRFERGAFTNACATPPVLSVHGDVENGGRLSTSGTSRSDTGRGEQEPLDALVGGQHKGSEPGQIQMMPEYKAPPAASPPKADGAPAEGVAREGNSREIVPRQGISREVGSPMTGRKAKLMTMGTAGVVFAGGMAIGWDIFGLVIQNLPWIGTAYELLNEIAEIVDTKTGLNENMEKIKTWAIDLRDVLVLMANHMHNRQSTNQRALEQMSGEVIANLQTLVHAVASYESKGALAQYAASRSCQRAVDAADHGLRGALAKLAVGQGAEIMSMVSNLQDVSLVVDDKLNLIVEQLRRHEEHTARLEVRLAEYSESMAEVLEHMAHKHAKGSMNNPSSEKTLRELGKEALDKLQIAKDDVKYTSNVPFATGNFSEVYQVVHEGAIKAAKKTNLGRLALGSKKDTDRLFKRFVKELYILSQMHSDRVVTVYGAIATPTELTLIMEIVERGSLRTILDDEVLRSNLTPEVKHGLLVDTAAGMKYLYKNGVEHRDLKSANCLVTHDWRVKISDFGLAKTTDAISMGSTSTICSIFRGGTLVYMAPELLPGGVGIDGEIPAELTDAYSFGVIAWDVLCGNGRRPWAGFNVEELPLALKMGNQLEIDPACHRFYRKLMVNCWRPDAHRRPNFERILYLLNKFGAASGGQFSFTGCPPDADDSGPPDADDSGLSPQRISTPPRWTTARADGCAGSSIAATAATSEGRTSRSCSPAPGRNPSLGAAFTSRVDRSERSTDTRSISPATRRTTSSGEGTFRSSEYRHRRDRSRSSVSSASRSVKLAAASGGSPSGTISRSQRSTSSAETVASARTSPAGAAVVARRAPTALTLSGGASECGDSRTTAQSSRLTSNSSRKASKSASATKTPVGPIMASLGSAAEEFAAWKAAKPKGSKATLTDSEVMQVPSYGISASTGLTETPSTFDLDNYSVLTQERSVVNISPPMDCPPETGGFGVGAECGASSTQEQSLSRLALREQDTLEKVARPAPNVTKTPSRGPRTIRHHRGYPQHEYLSDVEGSPKAPPAEAATPHSVAKSSSRRGLHTPSTKTGITSHQESGPAGTALDSELHPVSGKLWTPATSKDRYSTPSRVSRTEMRGHTLPYENQARPLCTEFVSDTQGNTNKHRTSTSWPEYLRWAALSPTEGALELRTRSLATCAEHGLTSDLRDPSLGRTPSRTTRRTLSVSSVHSIEERRRPQSESRSRARNAPGSWTNRGSFGSASGRASGSTRRFRGVEGRPEVLERVPENKFDSAPTASIENRQDPSKGWRWASSAVRRAGSCDAHSTGRRGEVGGVRDFSHVITSVGIDASGMSSSLRVPKSDGRIRSKTRFHSSTLEAQVGREEDDRNLIDPDRSVKRGRKPAHSRNVLSAGARIEGFRGPKVKNTKNGEPQESGAASRDGPRRVVVLHGFRLSGEDDGGSKRATGH